MLPRLNRQFIIVFQPKPESPFARKGRFAVGAYSLRKYIGEKNANTALERALRSVEDKCTIKFRKHGSVQFYYK
jgi:hypothetical protein